jgi:hypothetical protein
LQGWIEDPDDKVQFKIPDDRVKFENSW